MNKENGSFSKDEKLKVLEEYTRRGTEEANSQGLLVSFFLGLLSFLSTRYLVAQSVGLSWDQRLVRNARAQSRVKPTITLFGVPDAFAALLGLRTS